MLKEAGNTIKDACDASGISRSSYYSAKEVRVVEWKNAKDDDLLGMIKRISLSIPFGDTGE